MSIFLQLLFGGLALGAIYAIVALGFVLVFKATSVLNFAHGAFVMGAAFLAVTVLVTLDLLFLAGIVLVGGVMAAAGIFIHYAFMQWMVGKAFFSIVLVTVGIEILLRAGVLVAYGPLDRGRIQKLPTGSMEVGGAVIPFVNLIIVVFAAIVVVAFLAFFRYTRLGLHMRAVAENLEAAVIQGIDANRVYAAAWAIGLLMAGIGGVLVGHFSASIGLGLGVLGLRAFPVAILGGLDSIVGAIVGGLIIGVAENLGAGYLGAEWRDVIAFGIMFLVLLVRPYGLFGTKELVRV